MFILRHRHFTRYSLFFLGTFLLIFLDLGTWSYVVFCILIVAWMFYADSRGFRRVIFRHRSGKTFEDFKTEFDGSSVDEDVLERVYSDFVTVCGHHVMRSDNWHSLGLNHDDANDLEDVIQYTFQETGLGRSLYEKYADLSWAPSIEDYVRFLTEAYKARDAEEAQTKPS